MNRINRSKKNVSGKKKIYCYTREGGDKNWTLFIPRHESAGIENHRELEMQLIRIRTFRKGTDKVLCISMSGKAPQKLINLGPDPRKAELRQYGAKVHKLITL